MIIDFHTHIFPAPFREDRAPLLAADPAFRALYASPEARMAGAAHLIAAMDREGVDRSVVFGFPWQDPELYRRHNDYVLDAVGRHPERLIGLACFSPLAEGAAREAERCLQSGLSGVGEIALYGAGITAEVVAALRELMSLCAAHDVPVLVHTNEPIGHSYPGKTPVTLRQIYDFIKAYPANRIILAHWGGGLFFYNLMKKEVPAVLANVWLDTAASPFLYRARIYPLAGELLGFDRILFGSDFPLLEARRYFREMEEAGLPPEAAAKVKGLNAARLLKLKS